MRYLSRQAKFDDSTHTQSTRLGWAHSSINEIKINTEQHSLRVGNGQKCLPVQTGEETEWSLKRMSCNTTNIKRIEVVNKRLSLCHLWSQHGKYLHVCRAPYSSPSFSLSRLSFFCLYLLCRRFICCPTQNEVAMYLAHIDFWACNKWARASVCVFFWWRFLLPVHRVLFNYCLCVISTVFDYLFHLCVQIKCFKLSIIYDAIDTSFFFAALLAMIMSAFLRLFCIFISFALFFGLVMVMAHRPHSFYAFNNVRSLSVLI